eukprot:s2077_g21.t1
MRRLLLPKTQLQLRSWPIGPSNQRRTVLPSLTGRLPELSWLSPPHRHAAAYSAVGLLWRATRSSLGTLATQGVERSLLLSLPTGSLRTCALPVP